MKRIKGNPALQDPKELELNEEWSNFMQRVGHVKTLVRDMASGDKNRSDAATQMADRYLQGKIILDENIKLKVKDNRTVINKKAFKSMDNKDKVRLKKVLLFVLSYSTTIVLNG